MDVQELKENIEHVFVADISDTLKQLLKNNSTNQQLYLENTST